VVWKLSKVLVTTFVFAAPTSAGVVFMTGKELIGYTELIGLGLAADLLSAQRRTVEAIQGDDQIQAE
jgi:hypothetical protein